MIRSLLQIVRKRLRRHQWRQKYAMLPMILKCENCGITVLTEVPPIRGCPGPARKDGK